MRGQKRAFLVDFDNTILNTDSVRIYWMKVLKKNKKISNTSFIDAYKKSKSTTGYLNTQKLAQLLKINKKFFYDTSFKEYLFPHTIENLKYLKKMGKTLILSTGDNSYQPFKIKKSGIEKIIGRKNIRITSNKKVALKRLLNKLIKSGYKNIFIIDDIAETLVEAKKIYSEVVTIWVRFGKYKNVQPTKQSAITIRVRTFNEATGYIRSRKSNH